MRRRSLFRTKQGRTNYLYAGMFKQLLPKEAELLTANQGL